MLVLLTIIFWGIFGFFSKIAATRIGLQSLIWGSIFTIPPIAISYLAITKQLSPLNLDKIGITASLLGGAAAIIGSIFFTILLKNQQVSLVVPFTGLYPLATIILALIFLGERLSAIQVLGIGLAIVSLILISRGA